MALAKHAVVRLRLSDLVADALDFLRDGWKDAWLPMALIVAAHGLGFVHKHVAPADWRPGIWGALSPVLYLAYVPLYGALYRAAIGGPLFKAIGFGGLQWRAAEWRLILIGAVVAVATALAMLPFLAATGIAALILGLKSTVTMGPLGQWARWTPAAVGIWLVFLWAFGPRLARLALGWPYSVARNRLDLFGGWGPSFCSGWAILLAFLLVQIPTVLANLAPAGLALFEPDTLSAAYWPLPEAATVGVVQGLLFAVIQAPLSVGVLAGAYYLLEEARHGLDEPTAPAPDLTPEAAAALSGQEAHELDLPPSEVDAAAAASDAHGGVHALEDNEPPHVDVSPEPEMAESEVAAAESHDPPPPTEAHTPDPALEGVHPAEPPPATDAAADEAQAIEHHAEALHAAEAAAAEHPEPELEAAADRPSDSGELPQPLSRWPHSVLPPWPRRTAAPAPAAESPAGPPVGQPVAGTATGPATAMPLAPGAEDPHERTTAPSAPSSTPVTSPWEWSAL